MAAFGLLIISSKFSTLMSSATPNMMKERAILRKTNPEGEKLRRTWSRTSSELFNIGFSLANLETLKVKNYG